MRTKYCEFFVIAGGRCQKGFFTKTRDQIKGQFSAFGDKIIRFCQLGGQYLYESDTPLVKQSDPFEAHLSPALQSCHSNWAEQTLHGNVHLLSTCDDRASPNHRKQIHGARPGAEQFFPRTPFLSLGSAFTPRTAMLICFRGPRV